ncbi:MAG: hypothetical protein FRX49_10422 [Trebouxia sp. A1-2]|nr:MAG: hypothetical protein FRX49_10422 [Trebouxia sp. A1-2]
MLYNLGEGPIDAYRFDSSAAYSSLITGYNGIHRGQRYKDSFMSRAAPEELCSLSIIDWHLASPEGNSLIEGVVEQFAAGLLSAANDGQELIWSNIITVQGVYSGGDDHSIVLQADKINPVTFQKVSILSFWDSASFQMCTGYLQCGLNVKPS